VRSTTIGIVEGGGALYQRGMDSHDAPPGRDGHFPSTHWTLIARLRSADEGAARRAIEELCAQYHYPLYCYIRRRGIDHHDAQDALHDFLVKLLRLHAFEDAEAEKGRLRSFLAASLQRFLANWHRDHSHQRREVGLEITFDDAKDEERFQRERFSDEDTPALVFERKWCSELLSHVLRKLGELYSEKDKTPLFKALRPVLKDGGSLRGHDTAAIAASLSITEGTLRVALSRLLDDYRDVLRQEVAQTVAGEKEVREEISHLLGLFKKN
jgi:RNA polymerase sigma-70 factor (ECF subfamily)